MSWAKNILVGGGLGLSVYLHSTRDKTPEESAPPRPRPVPSAPATPHPSTQGLGKLGELFPANGDFVRFAGIVRLRIGESDI
ncbi:MAG: hypothetical protein AAB834_03540, partial [Patescibacteria group bacterium]